MNINWKTWASILLIPIIAVGVWYVLSRESGPPGTAFAKEGNLIKDNPGFERGVWYLSYEEPSAPGLAVKLVFDPESRCDRVGILGTCDMSYQEGERVRVEGEKTGSTVRVQLLTYMPQLQNGMEEGTRIKLYFYNPALDQGPGGVQCTEKGLVAVERMIPKTMTPLKDSILLLLRGELSDEERAQGVTTEFPLEGVALEKAVIQNGIATLTFRDFLNKTGGGSCRVAILWHQIEATAKQFPTVQFVKFEPEELFQP